MYELQHSVFISSTHQSEIKIFAKIPFTFYMHAHIAKKIVFTQLNMFANSLHCFSAGIGPFPCHIVEVARKLSNQTANNIHAREKHCEQCCVVYIRCIVHTYIFLKYVMVTRDAPLVRESLEDILF